MTDVPSTLDAWNGSAQNELDRLVERARSSGRLTQHDLVKAFSNVEMTPDVLAEIYRRCRAEGIVVEETEDLDLEGEGDAPAQSDGPLPGRDLPIDASGSSTV